MSPVEGDIYQRDDHKHQPHDHSDGSDAATDQHRAWMRKAAIRPVWRGGTLAGTPDRRFISISRVVSRPVPAPELSAR